ncbi:putative lipoprotein [Leptospira alstonii serovar Pingchang str. 80-412]|uniref:Lipoprotein n=3 Tax=Leptospira alstonii TaxID=28452 RepID=T0HFE7_9LEPT|nr:putative lipoprotein [Leptospira alstonii serovar Sichuan str. 79601]EQA82443.1 putative lipoprotein [Leptospira alstonii serovar Pingchang str. 80-412]
MFESMKKIVLISSLILFLFAACKKKEELILGDWVKVKECSEKGECADISKEKRNHLQIFPQGLAKYDTFHLTYKMQGDDIHFNLADLAFDLEYKILNVNEKELRLFNKKTHDEEYFEKN